MMTQMCQNEALSPLNLYMLVQHFLITFTVALGVFIPLIGPDFFPESFCSFISAV